MSWMKSFWKLTLSSILIAAIAFVLLPSSSRAQAQTAGIDPDLLAKAAAGDKSSQSEIGMAYSLGDVVPKDYAKAASWYRKAAEQGDSWAQYSLGWF